MGMGLIHGATLPYDSVNELRGAMYQAHPHLMRLGEIAPGTAGDIEALAGRAGKLGKSAFTSAVGDFYLTNPIARASAVMAECSALARERQKGTGTDG
jgi:NADH-quinone oxidoreductase subunit G